MSTIYTKANFPHFVCHNGNWDIYADSKGYCASIPTPEAAAQGCRATHFGDAAYVRATLGVTVMVPQPVQQQQARHAPGGIMYRDYCAHVADFYGHQAGELAFGSDVRAYDRAWEAWCAYDARAKRGVRFGAWL